MTVKLQKVGNSHMMTIPVQVVRQANLQVGDELKVNLEETQQNEEQKQVIKVEKEEMKKNKNFADIATGRLKPEKKVSFEEEMEAIKTGAYERLRGF